MRYLLYYVGSDNADLFRTLLTNHTKRVPLARPMAEFVEVFDMIEIKNLDKVYICRKAVENINLTLPRGEIVGLFGETRRVRNASSSMHVPDARLTLPCFRQMQAVW